MVHFPSCCLIVVSVVVVVVVVFDVVVAVVPTSSLSSFHQCECNSWWFISLLTEAASPFPQSAVALLNGKDRK